MEPIIKIENLSKIYRLGQVGTGTIRDDFKRWMYKLQGKEDPFLKVGETNVRSNKGGSDYVWALKDINLEVMPGEVLGIIGKNGAGKSTLLKILSKVTGPTTGSINYNGRIGSLLEVGTGFHPELTGRENIFLNGAILGMTKLEIRSKLDEIIDFSDCERYIDTPVKRYSSGMMVRLGFAVAAHLEPEILVVDEVLAVGDAEFQKKALGKMQDVSRDEGRTILFVSHNMATVKSLCSRSILLTNGSITIIGDTYNVVSLYLKDNIANNECSIDLTNSITRLPKMKSVLNKVELKNKDNNLINNFSQDDEIFLQLHYDGSLHESLAGAGFIIYSQDEVRVGGGNTYMSFKPPHRLPKIGSVIFKISNKQFTPGRYYVTISLGSHQGTLIDKVEKCIAFNIVPADIYGTGYILTSADGVSSLSFESTIIS